MNLANKLSHPKIEAAKILHDHCEEWKLQERAFELLQKSNPSFGDEATLLKLAVVNGLYRTQENDVPLVAKHMVEVIPEILSSLKNPGFDPASAVEHLATFVVDRNKPPRHCESLASKFAHFFISAELFPIYDSYASKMVNYHLRGVNREHIKAKDYGRYELFYKDFIELKRFAPKSCSNRELDWYLWMEGHLMDDKTSGMLTRLFAMPEVANEVKVLKSEDA